VYYNIKIKSNNSEFTLESNNKSITQREMDIYFAHIFNVSEEFKSKIKKVEIIDENVKSIEDFEANKIEQVQINTIKQITPEIKTNTREQITPEIQTNTIEQIIEKQPKEDIFSYQEAPKDDFEEIQEVQIEDVIQEVEYKEDEELARLIEEAKKYTQQEEKTNIIQKFTNEPIKNINSNQHVQNENIINQAEQKNTIEEAVQQENQTTKQLVKHPSNLTIEKVDPMIKTDEDYKKYEQLTNNKEAETKEFDTLPPDVNIPASEIIKFTQTQAEDEKFIKEFSKFIDTSDEVKEESLQSNNKAEIAKEPTINIENAVQNQQTSQDFSFESAKNNQLIEE